MDENTIKSLADAVLEAWLETGDPITVAGLAARLGLAEAKIRRIMNANHGAVPGTRCADAYITQALYNGYPTMGTRDRKVQGWVPDMARVRALVRDLRSGASS